MNPFTVPDLILEIASYVDAPQDLSHLTQVDRLAHHTVLPRLFRNIEVLTNSSVGLLARTIRRVRRHAALCRSLSLCTFDKGTKSLYTDLITIFNAISFQGLLVSLKWQAVPRKDQDWALPENVSTALSSVLTTLRTLDLSFISHRTVNLGYLTGVPFPHLRVLRLTLSNVYNGRDCSDIEALLDMLPKVEELALELPLYCRCRKLPLASTHPHLKRFSFDSFSLEGEDCDFLTRHPTLESLSLDTNQTFSDLIPGNSLRALSVNVERQLFRLSPAHLRITHLRLRNLNYGDLNHLTMRAFADLLAGVKDTLRCLEIDVSSSDKVIAPKIRSIIGTVPTLDELGITALRADRDGPMDLLSDVSTPASVELLNDLLSALPPASTLRALRVHVIHPLPPSWLDDPALAPLPHGLKYLGWASSSQCTNTIYVIEKKSGRNVVGRTIDRARPTDWLTEGVLGYVGEPWTA
ncbi:hypothetical protein C8R46DRAFT_1116227 [Mycena filopes]|nr:hypothetical protein C8R46DRAFT_1116227 [Mycena filopes]